MDALSSFLSVNRSCDETLDLLSQSLSQKGLRVLRTFDLYNARGRLDDCPCPYHGTSQCDCELMVVLVYGSAEEPVTLMLHGNDGQTWLSIVNNSLQRAAPTIRLSIEEALQDKQFE